MESTARERYKAQEPLSLQGRHILIEVLNRFEAGGEDVWCKGVYAEDANGNTANPEQEEAVRFCAAGMITRVAADLHLYDHKENAYNHLRRYCREGSIITTNERDGLGAVIDRLRAALA